MGSKTRLSSYCTKRANNGVNLATSRKINTRLARPILPVDNNEHQRIDDVSTDRISYDIRSVETMGFAL